jgi:hypothetical protein
MPARWLESKSPGVFEPTLVRGKWFKVNDFNIVPTLASIIICLLVLKIIHEVAVMVYVNKYLKDVTS